MACVRTTQDFDIVEPLLALRTVLLRIMDCNEVLPKYVIDFARRARKAGSYQIAFNALHTLSDRYTKR